MNQNDTVKANYTFGPGIDNPLMMNRNGSSYYYVKDGLGSVIALIDNSGNLVHEYKYLVFGKIIEETGDSVENPFTYTSRERDGETGNYYYRMRYYSPGSGRFLSEDPIGFGGGDANFYVYTLNNPVKWNDPFGLKILAWDFETQQAYAIATKSLCPEAASVLYALEQSSNIYWVQYSPNGPEIHITSSEEFFEQDETKFTKTGGLGWFSDQDSFLHEIIGHFQQFEKWHKEGLTKKQVKDLIKKLRPELEKEAEEWEKGCP
jgi:RHS repeat-associated protein